MSAEESTYATVGTSANPLGPLVLECVCSSVGDRRRWRLDVEEKSVSACRAPFADEALERVRGIDPGSQHGHRSPSFRDDEPLTRDDAS
jgi:hypothetical protein